MNHRDEVRVLPYGSAPAPFLFVRIDPLLKVEFAQMWKHICFLPSCAKSSLAARRLFNQSPVRV
jgi:hypothetical protein